MWDRRLTIFILAISSFTVCISPASALGQWNAFFRNEAIYRAGEIVSISNDPQSALFRVDDVLGGDDAFLGREIEVKSVAQLGKFSLDVWDVYPSRPEKIALGSHVLCLFHEDGVTPARCYPHFVIDRVKAVNEWKGMRSKVLADEIEADFDRPLLSALGKISEPFWGEHREGALVHPRVEEILDLLLELEKRTSHDRLSPISRDAEAPLLLRAATAQALRRERGSAESEQTCVDWVQELRRETKTPQNAIALVSLLDSIYGRPSGELSLPPPEEFLEEALDAKTQPLEYRLAVAKRLRGDWRASFHRQRTLAIMNVMESEPCNPTPGIPKPPADVVGDWLVGYLGVLADNRSRREAGLEGVDLSKLHPTVQRRLRLIPSPNPPREGD